MLTKLGLLIYLISSPEHSDSPQPYNKYLIYHAVLISYMRYCSR